MSALTDEQRARLVETMARAMYEANHFVKPWDHPDTVKRWHFLMRLQAIAARDAAERAGFEWSVKT